MDLLVLSLFSGAGGLDLGFKQAGFRTALAIDIDKYAVETIRANFPHTEAVQADLSCPGTLDLILTKLKEFVPPPGPGRLFGIIGGPPCQGFSVMNASNNGHDPRNDLVFKYAEILREVNRRFTLDFFVFENVPALNGKYRTHLEKACNMFAAGGFEVSRGELDAIEFGVPQYRRRVFVVGINKRYQFEFDFDRIGKAPGEPRSVWHAIGHLPPLDASNNYARTDIHPNFRSMRPYSAKIAQIEPGDMRSKSFKRLAWNLPSPTVAYGHNEVHIHPAKGEQDRRLSTYEAMLLQGFPHDFVFQGTLSAWQRLVSEAVSPPVARAIGKTLREELENLQEEQPRVRAANQ